MWQALNIPELATVGIEDATFDPELPPMQFDLAPLIRKHRDEMTQNNQFIEAKQDEIRLFFEKEVNKETNIPELATIGIEDATFDPELPVMQFDLAPLIRKHRDEMAQNNQFIEAKQDEIRLFFENQVGKDTDIPKEEKPQILKLPCSKLIAALILADF